MKKLYLFLFFLIFICKIFANPDGGKVIHGEVDIVKIEKDLLHINQNSDKAIINWDNFSIKRGEKTEIFQPSKTSILLNRVFGNLPSEINGILNANGIVYLVNDKGIMIGKEGVIKSSGFIASTLKMTDESFLKGRKEFSSAGFSKFENKGTIESTYGDIYIVAPEINNQGKVVSNARAIFASADEVLFISKENGLAVKTKGKGYISQEGIIEAKKIELRAESGDLSSLAINLKGNIRATSLKEENGEIYLIADSGIVEVRGNIEAKKEDGKKGGTIHILADNIGIFEESHIDATGVNGGGEILIGGDYQGKNPLIKNAKNVYVDEKVFIDASAIESGNGGKIILWGDDGMFYRGTIKAEGGKEIGDGGFVEISSHGFWHAPGKVTTKAYNGDFGNFYIDPVDASIVAGTADFNAAYVAGTYSFSGIFATIGAGTVGVGGLANHLESNSVLIDVLTPDLSQTGIVTITNSFTWNSGTTLTILAARIIINNSVNITNTSPTTGFNAINFDASVGGGPYKAGIQGSSFTIQTVGGNILLKGTGGNGGNDSNGIYFSSANISSEEGNITLIGNAGGSSSSSYGRGMRLVGTTISAHNATSNSIGTIILEGTGGQGASRNQGVLIESSSAITIDDGNLYVKGIGKGVTAYNRGIELANSTIYANGNGELFFEGTGGINAGGTYPYGLTQNHGIVAGNVQITTYGNGGINFLGKGNGAHQGINDADNHYGVYFSFCSLFCRGSGSISITGIGGGLNGGQVLADANNYGVYINNSNVYAYNGDIDLVGTSYGNLDVNVGVYVFNNSTVRASYLDGTNWGTSSINIIGRGGDGTDYCEGVNISNSNLRTDTTPGDGGDIIIQGYGGSCSGSDNYGSYIARGASNIISSDGLFSISGIGGSGTEFNHGVQLQNLNTSIAKKDITINGIGGAGSSDRNYGIYINTCAIPIADNNLTMNGSSSVFATGNFNHAIYSYSSTLSSSGGTGNISLKGTIASANDTDNNIGVFISGGGINASTKSAIVSIEGSAAGSNASSGNVGVKVETGAPAFMITADKLSIDGFGQGNEGHGIYFEKGRIAGGSEEINLNGVSIDCINANGIYLNGGAGIETSSGSINCSGENQGTLATGPNHGTNISTSSYLKTSSGSIFVSGTSGSDDSTDSNGVNIEASSYLESQSGKITVHGRARGTDNTNAIAINASEIRTFQTGADINCIGISVSEGANNFGVSVIGSSKVYSGGAGKITLDGKSGNAVTSTDRNYGVYVAASEVYSQGQINLNSANGISTGDFNHAIYMFDQSTITMNGSNDIIIYGASAFGNTGDENHGVYIDHCTIDATATPDSNIDITGHGNGASTFNCGIYTDSISASPADHTKILAFGGNINYAGYSTNGIGAYIQYTTIENISGDITLFGEGDGTDVNQDYEGNFFVRSQVNNNSGLIDIQGIAKGVGSITLGGVSITDSDITNLANGDIFINGEGLNHPGTYIFRGNITNQDGSLQLKGEISDNSLGVGMSINALDVLGGKISSNGDIELISNALDMQSITLNDGIETPGNVYVLPINVADTMAIGYVDTSLDFYINATSLGFLNNQSYSNLFFGNSSYDADITIGDGSAIDLSNGNVVFSGKNITIDSPLNCGSKNITCQIGNLSSGDFNANQLVTTSGNFNVTGGIYLDNFYFYVDGQVAYVNGDAGTNLLQVGSNWYLTGKNQGTVDNIEFENIQYLVGGNNDDTFRFADGASVDGIIDGGIGGYNILDYSEYISPVYVDIAAGTATGTAGITNIDGYILPNYINIDSGDNVVNLFLGLSMNNFDYFYDFSPYYFYFRIFLEETEAKIIYKDNI